MGGTLLFPNPSVGEIYAEVLSGHGFKCEATVLEDSFMRVWKQEVLIRPPSISPESERERWRSVIDRTFVDLAPGVDLVRLFDDLWIAFAEASRWRLPAHTERTLTELRERGYRLAVLSNWDDRLRPLMTQIGLDSHFEEVFVSCELGFEKPDPRLFSLVEKQLLAAGEEILHIGDSHHHDVLGAHARGWRAVQVFAEETAESQWPRIACLSELLDLLPGNLNSTESAV